MHNKKPRHAGGVFRCGLQAIPKGRRGPQWLAMMLAMMPVLIATSRKSPLSLRT